MCQLINLNVKFGSSINVIIEFFLKGIRFDMKSSSIDFENVKHFTKNNHTLT